jgi:hypothetical protein
VHSLVPEPDFRQLRESLPETEDQERWSRLFEVVDARGWKETGGASTDGGP